MRPARPGNDPHRRDDARRDRRANPADDRNREREVYTPAPGSYEPDDYGTASRDADPRGSRRRAPRDRAAGAADPPPREHYRQTGPARPVDDHRNRRSSEGAGDPYLSRDQDRQTRPAPRMDRSGFGRARDDRSRDYPPADPPPRPRYGTISPSDDLAWPDAEPAEADWQPADPRARGSGSRNAPPPREEPYPRQTYGAVPENRFEPPTRQPAWSTYEANPRPIIDDDLAYDVSREDDEPARRTDGDPTGDDLSGTWPAPRTNIGAEPDSVDGEWYRTEQDLTQGDQLAEDADRTEPLRDDDPRAAVFDDPDRPSRRSSSHGDGVRPPVWGMSGYAWRFARRLTIPRTNRLLRFGASRVLPASTQARFEAMGLPPTEVDETLRQVRSLDDWAEAWTGTAQRFLGETRRGGDMTPVEAARSRQLAALCYHVAAFFAFGDDRLARTSRSAATTLFGQSLGLLMPETRQVNVRWRSKTMPGYLTVPSWATGRRPLAVLLNGATTSREELILWSDEFLAQGIAVLALDTPGFGEGTALGTVSLDNDDIMDGIFELAESDPGLDPTKVSLIGISLGGTMALRAAAGERRVSAVVSVTPVFEPARWLGASSQVSLAQMVPLFGGYDQLADFVLGLDMPATLAETQAQVLVFGAGKDLVVPPPEASRLAAVLGEQSTLVWFDDAGHALFDVVPEWTREAAEWLAVVMDVSDAPIFTEPVDDDHEESYPSDDESQDGGELNADAYQAGSPILDVPDVDQSVEPETSSFLGHRPSPRRRGPAPSPEPDRPRMTQAPAPPVPEPEPYGAGVFDASEGPERRSEEQRGYETGVFGPLGPAAARILADEPTPQPGSPEWGDEDSHPWTSGETPSSPWDEAGYRSATSTARLWETPEPGARPAPEFHPTMASPIERPIERPVERPVEQTPIMTPATEPSPTAPSRQATPTGDYLTASGPSVGRGRTSGPFVTVPASDADQTTGSETGGTAPRESESEDVRVSGVPRIDSAGSPRENSPDDGETNSKDGEPDGVIETNPDDDTHAPFRPPSSQTE